MASHVADDPTIRSGVRLGDYRILSRLSTGGTGDFWLALSSHEGGHIVVIKVLQPWQKQRQRDYLDLIQLKAELVGRLRHPGLPRVLGVEHTAAHDYIVMEYAAGRTLEDLRDGPTPPPLFSIAVVAQLCDVLHYLHGQALTPEDPQLSGHQFLSPRKIVVSFSGRVQILGTGVAQANAKVHDIPSDARFAKFAYLAPEHLRPGSSAERSDIYGVGVVLYTLLTGQEPFPPVSSLYGLIQRIQEGNPRPIAQLNPAALAPLRSLVEQAMQVQPDKRPDRDAVHTALGRARAMVPEDGTTALRAYVAAMFPGAPVVEGLLEGLHSYLIAGTPAAVATFDYLIAGTPAAVATFDPGMPTLEALVTAPPAAGVAEVPAAPTRAVSAARPPTGDIFAARSPAASTRTAADSDLYSASGRLAPPDVFAVRSSRPTPDPAADPSRDIFSPTVRAPAADVFTRTPSAADAFTRTPSAAAGPEADPFAAADRNPRDLVARPRPAATGDAPPAGTRDLASPRRGADPFARRGQGAAAAARAPERVGLRGDGDVFAHDRGPRAPVGGDPFSARAPLKEEPPQWPALQAPRPPRERRESQRESRRESQRASRQASRRVEPSPAPERGARDEDRPPSDATRWFEQGLLALRDGDLGEAMRLWQAAVDLEPASRIYQANLQRLRSIGEKR